MATEGHASDNRDTEAPEPADEDWCTRCDRVVEIVDEFDETIREVGNREVDGHVIQFECGHSLFFRDDR